MNKLYLIMAISISSSEIGLPTNKLDAETVAGIVSKAFFWGGVLAVIMIITAGLYYVTSAGDATNVEKAKSMILYSCVGLIVMILASAIVKFILGNF